MVMIMRKDCYRYEFYYLLPLIGYPNPLHCWYCWLVKLKFTINIWCLFGR